MTDALQQRPVLVVDFGAQYAQLIARRVREANAYSEIVPHTFTTEQIMAKNPAAIILSGGPSSVYADQAPDLDPALLEAGVPMFGLCYGFQAMAKALGGRVERTGLSEYGATQARVLDDTSTLFNGQPREQSVWMSHGDAVVEAPAKFYPQFTGTENLQIHANLAGMAPGRERIGRDRIREVLALLELTRMADRRVTEYSLGQRQRLGVASAILNKSLVESSLSLLVLVLIQAGVSAWSARSVRAQAAFDNRPVVLVEHGQLCEQAMRSARISPAILHQNMRQAGVESLSDIKFAVLESGGAISLVRQER